jgi:hypothetical protein
MRFLRAMTGDVRKQVKVVDRPIIIRMTEYQTELALW